MRRVRVRVRGRKARTKRTMRMRRAVRRKRRGARIILLRLDLAGVEVGEAEGGLLEVVGGGRRSKAVRTGDCAVSVVEFLGSFRDTPKYLSNCEKSRSDLIGAEIKAASPRFPLIHQKQHACFFFWILVLQRQTPCRPSTFQTSLVCEAFSCSRQQRPRRSRCRPRHR